jgi:cytochrome P450/NADPH-cytochrome P450 reductase
MTDHNNIPQPKPSWLLGNLRDLEKKTPVQGFWRLANQCGPIYQLKLMGGRLIVVSNFELVNELCDETRFGKRLNVVLKNIRKLTGDGLFTAYEDEPNWGVAHRLLTPAFGPIGVRSMFDQMSEVADQMILKWSRFGESAVIDVADNMTRLTLDTIALCAFDYRFNSFYQHEMHPFIDAMVGVLKEAEAKGRRLPIVNKFLKDKTSKFDQDIKLLQKIADELIQQRKDLGHTAKTHKDLLDLMLEGRDPITGEGLSDENVRYQMITFLIAGHETTSGLLSFAIYLLLKNPHVLQRLKDETEGVLQGQKLRVEHLSQLRYVEQVLMETLRLWPTAPGFALSAKEDTTLAGRYKINKRDVVMVLSLALHRDSAVWGDDAEVFNPDRFDSENIKRIAPNAWKPFGNGTRACIGRVFAMQESQIVLTKIVQQFDLIDHDPTYKLQISETLSIKPTNLKMRVKPRQDVFAIQALQTSQIEPSYSNQAKTRTTSGEQYKSPAVAPKLLILFGSNSGSCEMFSQEVSKKAADYGYTGSVKSLNEAAQNWDDQVFDALVIIAASYDGQPTRNADKFVSWLTDLPEGALANVSYCVLGCGNRQWARTYQFIPKLIDQSFMQKGANCILPRGEADANGNLVADFYSWLDDLLPSLESVLGKSDSVDATLFSPKVSQFATRADMLQMFDATEAKILINEELTNQNNLGLSSKRHIEIELPPSMNYQLGDHLAVLPGNSDADVRRVLRRFELPSDRYIIPTENLSRLSHLPTQSTFTISEILKNYVELKQPASLKQISSLMAFTKCPPDRKFLESLVNDDFLEDEALAMRLSVLDILEVTQSCQISVDKYLEMLPPLRPRIYSISSSPNVNPAVCSITVSVLDKPARSGQGRYMGVSSNYLATTMPGDMVQVAIRKGNSFFVLPSDSTVPIIMICAGSGIAPFRGFLQERQVLKSKGQMLGAAVLYFGCSHKDFNCLYENELMQWQSSDQLHLKNAYSKQPRLSSLVAKPVRYVQDLLEEDAAEIMVLIESGAHVYVCGDGLKMASAVRSELVRIYQDQKKVTIQQAEEWLNSLEKLGRYACDIFA